MKKPIELGEDKPKDKRDNFRENIIEDLPRTNPDEMTRPIGNIFKKTGKGQHTKLMNRGVMQRKQTEKRRAKNKAAKNARRRNRK